MRARPLVDGDMTPIISLDQMLQEEDAVAQVVDLRMKMTYGEWWEDETLGFKVPDFLVGNARSGDAELLAKYISSYISNTEGVRAVSDVEARYENHAIIFYCLVLTDYGETEIVEVDVNGLF